MNSFGIGRNVFGHDFTSKLPLNPTHAKIEARKKIQRKPEGKPTEK